MFINIPTDALISGTKFILKIVPTFFGVVPPHAGSLQVVSAKVVCCWIDKIQYSSTLLW